MALSSDEIIKREIIDIIGYKIGNLQLRIFPQSSNDDQILFENGGLTFSHESIDYGSCDACWLVTENSVEKPLIALEGTDALNRKSSGNAQYQRFHHALGAVKNGLIGVYYLKKGVDKIQEDLFGIAYYASQKEKGNYLIIDDLQVLKDLLNLYNNPKKFNKFIVDYLQIMFNIFKTKFDKNYGGSWDKFAEKRSTIIKEDYIIKHAGRMKRNFTDGSQRAGHIAVGEMYLTKYYFYDKKFYYLFPKMTKDDLKYLDIHKANDKEWHLLRHEPNVEIKTVDDIIGLSIKIKKKLISIKDEPLKGDAMEVYRECINIIDSGLRNDKLKIKT